MQQFPIFILALTVAAYWSCVVMMVLRVGSSAGGIRALLMPTHRAERFLSLAWCPVVILWVALPAMAALHVAPQLSATFIGKNWETPWQTARWLAAVVSLFTLLASIRCWRHMGVRWRMAVDPLQGGTLITDGPFALVRHPIYTLGLLLMMCSVVILPTAAMLVLAGTYFALVVNKVRQEERFLLANQGADYAAYCRATPRFAPRLNAIARALRATNGPDRPPQPSGSPLTSIPSQCLSPFQRAMLLWEELHPYNAAHVLRLRGAARPSDLSQAAEQVCGAGGIGRLQVHANDGTFTYQALDGIQVRHVTAAPSEKGPLTKLLSDELNTPFSADPQHPIRWTLLDDALHEGHWVIAVYRHVAADATSIEALLSAVIRAYSGESQAAPRMSWNGIEFQRIVGPLRRAQIAILGAIRTFVLYFRFRFMHKMPDDRTGDDRTHIILRNAPANLLARLTDRCRQSGVGRNDAFLAALASAVATVTPDRQTSRHRRGLSLATALNGRSLVRDADASKWFGNCVGDMLIMLRRPDVRPGDVVTQIAVQTRRQKKRRQAALAISDARLFFVRRVWPLFGVPHHRRSYRKIFPVCGGVSTHVASTRWFEGRNNGPMEYWRACPPGPAMPLVMAPTICNGLLTFGLVYRSSSLSDQKAELLFDHFLAALEELCGQRPAEVPVGSATPEGDRARRSSNQPSVSAARAGIAGKLSAFLRRRSWIAAVPILCSLFAGCPSNSGDAPPVDRSSRLAAGTHGRSIAVADRERTYWVHLPEGEGARPLVLILHGTGERGLDHLQGNSWITRANQAGFVAVAPDGLPEAPDAASYLLTNPRTWNAGQPYLQSERQIIDDVAFVDAVLADVEARATIDPARIFVAGHSSGGAMAFRLAADRPDRFAGLAVIASPAWQISPQAPFRVPTLFIVGSNDPLLPRDGGTQRTLWFERTTPSIDDILSGWAIAMGCEPHFEVRSDESGVRIAEFGLCDDATPLRAVVIEGQGHRWPGGTTPNLPDAFVGPSTDRVNATDMVWDFFSNIVIDAEISQ